MSVARLTQESEVPGPKPGRATYVCFCFCSLKNDICQLLVKLSTKKGKWKIKPNSFSEKQSADWAMSQVVYTTQESQKLLKSDNDLCPLRIQLANDTPLFSLAIHMKSWIKD